MNFGDTGIIGQYTSLAEMFRILEKVAPTDSTVLITGESGTGKELLVRALHRHSARADKPFVPINCGAIPKELLESELFGHEKGAFTHALKSRPGRFEMAEGGTVFLDEIGEMDILLQVKILRVLQEREIERVGGSGTKKIDVRIVAATNRNLEQDVATGHFREDLFYRLNVIPLHLPPLRERDEDVLLLMEHFLRRFCAVKKRAQLVLAQDVERILAAYSWPGNVRELENLAERLSILCDGDEAHPEDLPAKMLAQVGSISNLPPLKPRVNAFQRGGFTWPTISNLKELHLGMKDFFDIAEERLLDEALNMADGVKNQAAEILGIKRTTLIEKLKKRCPEE
ncbi:MAG: sigma-54 dependent transcriptional regulator [Desulfovibrio sp.]|jgi:transcriptional regulator with GAF, ATPase, and Fis domain|nr:sigma-54 dependent transcriptional regulator [Desulfovibrio sp.]